MSDDDFSEKYLVKKNDVADIKDFAKTSYKNNESPLLLRFALTDYYSDEGKNKIILFLLKKSDYLSLLLFRIIMMMSIAITIPTIAK